MIQNQAGKLSAHHEIKNSLHEYLRLSMILEHINSLFGYIVSKECDILGRGLQ